jgi:hypothetical protein
VNPIRAGGALRFAVIPASQFETETTLVEPRHHVAFDSCCAPKMRGDAIARAKLFLRRLTTREFSSIDILYLRRVGYSTILELQRYRTLIGRSGMFTIITVSNRDELIT